MRKRRLFTIAVLAPLAVAALIVRGGNVSAQPYYPTPTGSPSSTASGSPATASNNDIAVASVVNQHTHSIILQTQDVTDLIASLGNGGSVNIESSSGYDGGVPNGTVHTHQVPLTLQDLQTLQSTGTVSVLSDQAAGHQHQFTFITTQNCQASPRPSRSPSPSPSASASASPSPSASASPSPSPSTSPSGGPSESPSPGPTIT